MAEKSYIEQREGVYRVGDTRVSLDSIVSAFLGGHTAESIQQSFPILTWEQVYGAITYYRGNRSGSENLTHAIQSPHSIPCRHGNTACIITRGVGTAPPRSASLYSGPGSACRSIGGHGAGVTGAAQP